MSFETPVYPGISLDDNYGPVLMAAGIAFTIISALTVVLRFVSRLSTRVSIERDDWLIVAAPVSCWAYNAVIMVEADCNYYGQHIGKSDAAHLEEYMKGLYSLVIVYPIALTLSKLSLLALYWRIFRTSSAKRPIQIASLLNIGWMIAATLVGIFSCNPVSGFWDTSIKGVCIQEYNFFLTNEVLTIVLDLIVLVIPLWSIAQIQRSFSQRFSIALTFGLGLGVTVISAVRLWQLVEAAKRPGQDPTFNQMGAALWAIVEINTWVVVASIPALRPLVRKVIDGKLLSRVTPVGSSEKLATDRSKKGVLRTRFGQSAGRSTAEKSYQSLDSMRGLAKQASKEEEHSVHTVGMPAHRTVLEDLEMLAFPAPLHAVTRVDRTACIARK